jgi:hypothetical protein
MGGGKRMTTKRQQDDGFRGAEVHLHLHTPAKNYTTLPNRILRGQFQRPGGAPVRLKAGPRAALCALLSFGVDNADPAWRLDMDQFASLFVESKDTVYGWIRKLEAEGFVTRNRVNDPDTGRFAWRMDVWESPAALATVTPVDPQVAPIEGFSGDGAAPTVDNPDSRRSLHAVDSQGWSSPSRQNPDVDTSIREVSNNYLPASSSVGDARENEAAAERPFAITGQPRLVSTSQRTEDELGRAAGEWGMRFIASLTSAPQCQGKLGPDKQAQQLLAIRAEVARDLCGWKTDQLRNLLLSGLSRVDYLAGVWAWRLHPDHLPEIPGHQLAHDLETAGDLPPLPDARRRAEIRALSGIPRGARWEGLTGGVG